MFEIRVDGKIRVNVVNTAAAALSDVKLKVGGSPVMNGVVRDLSYDLNKAVPLTTSYLGKGGLKKQQNAKLWNCSLE